MTSLLKLAAICAHMSVAAHCHVYKASTPVPTKYVSATVRKDGMAPKITFPYNTAVFWEGNTLVILSKGGYAFAEGLCPFEVKLNVRTRDFYEKRGYGPGLLISCE